MGRKEAMQIAGAEEPVTIGQLREYLNELDQTWSEEDEKYLGAFNAQPLYVVTGLGVTNAFFQYHAEFGLTAFPVVRGH